MTDILPAQTNPPPENARTYGAKDSFELIGRRQGWQVIHGMVDVFLLDRSSVAAGFRYHLHRVEAGGLIFGALDADGATTSLLAVPGNNSVIAPFDLEQAPVPDETMVSILERWIGALASAMASDLPPIDATLVTGSQTFSAEKDEILVAHEHPLWLTRLPVGAEYLDFGPVDADSAINRVCLCLRRPGWHCPPVSRPRCNRFTDWVKDGSLVAGSGGIPRFGAPGCRQPLPAKEQGGTGRPRFA
jgi:hypothetical protein